MSNEFYRQQVSLLLKVLPEVAKESCFVLHGGTAINLFIRNMPRLSVDIDLTYVPIEPREETISHINQALERIKTRIEKLLSQVKVRQQFETAKLYVSLNGTDIKLEVNLVSRGLIAPSQKLKLCKKAESDYDAFVVMPVISKGQLYGGKISAALDRQHPRDLFDIHHLLKEEGITEEIKQGFIFCLAGSDRPIHEIIKPNLLDQRDTMEKHFLGMSDEAFSYEEFETIRIRLIELINASFSDRDKEFLLSVKSLEPRWDIYDFEKFPSIQWKLKNLKILKESNAKKYGALLNTLREKLYG